MPSASWLSRQVVWLGFAFSLTLIAPSTQAQVTCPSCNDQNACTVDSCDTTTGTCRHDLLQCDDGNPCTNDECRSNTEGIGGCFHLPRPDATPCDDGDGCTLGTSCSSGVCVAGEFLPANAPCDDGNPCTVSDACNSSHRCAGTPLGGGALCDDRNACTRDDRCVTGEDGAAVCEGTSLDCSDGELCTEDRCDPATGQCLHPPVSCQDGNACTTDTCDPATGLCRRDNVDGPCEDGRFCTLNEVCSGGNCVGGEPRVCPSSGCGVGRCVEEEDRCQLMDIGPCPPGDQCNAFFCQNGACRISSASGIPCVLPAFCGLAHCVRGQCLPDVSFNCDDGNSCTDDVCPQNYCTHPAKPDGTACNVGLCLTGTCQAGVCAGNTPALCDDGNPCTADSCDPSSGCRHTAIACDDDNPCTTDSCSPATGACLHAPRSNVPCGSDGCNNLFCLDGACTEREPISCDDGKACTQDSCDPALGGCVHRMSCDDGNTCTADICSASGECLYLGQPAGFPCTDFDPCTTHDLCTGPAATANVCVGTAISCDDGNPCTSDSCDPAIGCVHGGAGTPNPPPESCNGLDDDCDGQVDERELYPMCAVRPLVMRDSGTSKTFTVTCRWKPACPGAPVPAPLDEIRQVWLSAADLLLDPGDNAPLPNPFVDCDLAIVEDPAKRMTGDAAVTFVFDEDGDGVCGTGGMGRAGLMFHLADVPDGKLARVCVRSSRGGPERCGIVLVRHDTTTEPQPVNPGEEERRILLPAP